MRGTIAKRIRHKVYGLQSLRNPRRYRRLANGAIVSVGLRRRYQGEKKEYKARAWGGCVSPPHHRRKRTRKRRKP